MTFNFNMFRLNGNLDGRFAVSVDPSGPLTVNLNNDILTITTDGTYNFGAGPENVKFDDFSGGTLGSNVTPVNSMFDVTSQFYPAKFTGDSRSGGFAITGFDETAKQASINTVNLSDEREIFLSYAVKIPTGKYAPGNGTDNTGTNADYVMDSSWKLSWPQYNDGATNDICVPTNIGNGEWYLSGNGLSNKLITSEMGGNSPSWWGWNNWTRLSSYLKAGDVPQTDLGKVYFQAIQAGGSLFESSKDVVVFEGTNAVAPYAWNKWNIPGYARPNVGGSDGLGTDVMFLHDDVYIAWGNNAAARIEIGDNIVYENCTDLAMCKPTSWATDALQADLGLGAFSAGQSLFVHITLSDNTTRISGAIE
jgi:hypothetical protein